MIINLNQNRSLCWLNEDWLIFWNHKSKQGIWFAKEENLYKEYYSCGFSRQEAKNINTPPMNPPLKDIKIKFSSIFAQNAIYEIFKELNINFKESTGIIEIE